VIRTRELILSPEGEAGEATATGSLAVPACRLVAVGIDYTGVPATTDLTLESQGRTLLTRSDSNTDAFVQLAADVTDSAGATVENAFAQSPIVYGSITAAVAQADAAENGVRVTLYIEE
jgi:hypothetical protein